MSNELLEKVVTTGVVANGGGGLLNAEQSSRFIDYMWDATSLVQTARTIRMRSDTVDIDKVGVGTKLVRLATEATDTGVNAEATFTKISLTTKKLRLDWELSTESLEDNIEGSSLEDHIAGLMATQAGNDIEDLCINGDVSLTGDALYKSFDGWHVRALGGAHVVENSNTDHAIGRATFNQALKALPRKYKQRRNQLRFYTGSNTIQDYLYSLSNGLNLDGGTPEAIASGIITGNPAGPQGSSGGVYPYAFGIPITEVALQKEDLTGSYSGSSGDHGYVELTFPDNRIVGIKRDIVVYSKFQEKKDTVEYTMYTRVGVQIENLDAWVVVKDVKIAS
jgi:HK97 family phage major capsid protein